MSRLLALGGGASLRRLRREDIEAVARAAARGFGSPTVGEQVRVDLALYCDAGLADLFLEAQDREALPREYYTILLKEQGAEQRIVGVTGIYRFGRWTWDRIYWLGWTVLDADVQGRGIGSRCLQVVLRIARTRGGALMKVETGHHDAGGAGKFYEKNGFRPEAVLSCHYGPGDDALVLSRPLEDIEPLGEKERV